jgi:hypothetical protein
LLVEAVDFVIHSPSNLSLENFVSGLRTLASTIQNVLNSMPTGNREELQSKKNAMGQQIDALNFLLKAYYAGQVNQLSTPFNTIISPSQLYAVFVYEYMFAMAGMLYRSYLRKHLSAEALVLPGLKLSVDVKPLDHVSLLSEVVFPKLVINDDLLSRLKSWSCQLADLLDDKDEEMLDLDAALLLLQVICIVASALLHVRENAESHIVTLISLFKDC